MKSILGILKIIPLEFENTIEKELDSLKKINIEKYSKTYINRTQKYNIFLWKNLDENNHKVNL